MIKTDIGKVAARKPREIVRENPPTNASPGFVTPPRQQRVEWHRGSFGPEDCDPLQEEAEAEKSQANALPMSCLPGLPGCIAQNLLPLHRIIPWEKRRCRRHRRWCIAGGDEDQGSDHARHCGDERQPIADGQIEAAHDLASAAAKALFPETWLTDTPEAFIWSAIGLEREAMILQLAHPLLRRGYLMQYCRAGHPLRCPPSATAPSRVRPRTVSTCLAKCPASILDDTRRFARNSRTDFIRTRFPGCSGHGDLSDNDGKQLPSWKEPTTTCG
jgi:hypothetical protein